MRWSPVTYPPDINRRRSRDRVPPLGNPIKSARLSYCNRASERLKAEATKHRTWRPEDPTRNFERKIPNSITLNTGV
ncbi:hypothetical protein BESB_018730 [Besnoitia besnoiti]|uniref:Uncharacterized protein n=1 Tax=Besnoitia besnoiti TaxID=94643 RepID=A0A2A9M3L8_BESBE|nr:hypothetical protein BESB_018730 [Besnoitia besnoiti]PFH32555.1 hypothetical protein BESB_018730 [Besnoitia besnoiti]